jgi:heptosyltransferase-3
MEPRRVVVFRPGALGDALLAFPALAALRRAWPDGQLTLVARADVLPVARAAGLCDAAYPYDLPAWSGLWSGGEATGVDPLLRAVVGGADAIIAWLRDPAGDIARALAALGAKVAIVAPGQPSSPSHAEHVEPASGEHVTLYLLRTLAPLGVATTAPEHADPGWRARWLRQGILVGVARERREPPALPEGRVVALHPGSGGAAKRWPPERFAGLARRLRAARYTPLLIEGPADAAPVAAIGATLADAPVAVARNLTLMELAQALARCVAYVGNDSGVSHLAGLLGCPTLVLFGPSDPALWAPIGPRVHVLRAPAAAPVPSMADLDEAAVWAALTGMLTTA